MQGYTLIVGLGRSGVGAANMLVRQGIKVVINDHRNAPELKEYIERLDPKVSLSLGSHPEHLFLGADNVVLSPGVPLNIEPLKKARMAGIEVAGELEIAYRALLDMPFYAVTGTNGKSTTVTLLDLMLKKAGKKSFLGGNIGNSICEAISQMDVEQKYDSIVAEVSSFQLETIRDFKPRVAAILNITPDHMDRYDSIESYMDAKARITLNQRNDDFLVTNADDQRTIKLHARMINGRAVTSLPEMYFFSARNEVKGVFLRDKEMHYDIKDSGKIININDITIKGPHNVENAMAASAMALLAGCSVAAVREALMEFRGLEHRLEFVCEHDGVRYINDSKGTNVGAVLRSLEGFKDKSVVLIAGGRDKDGDFKKLGPVVQRKVKALVLIGEAAGTIESALSGSAKCFSAKDMLDAVEVARDIATGGDIVLLSPACASFDMFDSYEQRGQIFKEATKELCQ